MSSEGKTYGAPMVPTFLGGGSDITPLTAIAGLLAGYCPRLLEPGTLTQAAVALVLRQTDRGIEVLFIERASKDDDPWSGNIGLPGGKVEAGDGTPRRTAERETLEETGLDISSKTCMGRLSDIVGAHLPVQVSCYVFCVSEVPELLPSHEVKDIFWVSLAELNAVERHVTTNVSFGGESFVRPAIILPQADKPPLWGITYRFVMEFLQLINAH